MNKTIIDRAVTLLQEAIENGGGEVTLNRIAQVQGILETISSMLEDKAYTYSSQDVALKKPVPAIKLPANTEPPIPAKGGAFVAETGDYSPFPVNEPK